ncbi:hypothetical protein R3P38DRAFT_3175294 [Favolaschia claudopus]|uniref:Uncharacterized protein n=1 Tax=Favolaschia claudopus TaxID=2862362 RepID=A0AAW0DCF3_9AGAR
MDSLRSWEDENWPDEEDEEDEEIVNSDVLDMTEEDWQIFARDQLNAAVPQFGVSDLGVRPLYPTWNPDAARTRWESIAQMGRYHEQQKREAGAAFEDIPAHIDIDTLAAEQRAIFNG